MKQVIKGVIPTLEATQELQSRFNSISDSVVSFKEDMKKEQSELANKLSDLSKLINDIYHAIEFNNLTIKQQNRIYKLLKSTLETRRYVKNSQDNLLEMSKHLTFTQHINIENETRSYKYNHAIVIDILKGEF